MNLIKKNFKILICFMLLIALTIPCMYYSYAKVISIPNAEIYESIFWRENLVESKDRVWVRRSYKGKDYVGYLYRKQQDIAGYWYEGYLSLANPYIY